MIGPPTGDFHSIYNAPMLGAHKASEATPKTAPTTARFPERLKADVGCEISVEEVNVRVYCDAEVMKC